VVGLPDPFINLELAGTRFDYLSGAFPVRVLLEVSGTVNDRIPVNKARKPGIIDDASESFIFGLSVRDHIAGDELVVELSKGEFIAFGLVFGNDGISRFDYLKG
jgi:hypothetical protein